MKKKKPVVKKKPASKGKRSPKAEIKKAKGKGLKKSLQRAKGELPNKKVEIELNKRKRA